MPGALERLDLNPFAQYSQYTGKSQADYDAGVAKGYKWGGTDWSYVGGGDPSQWTDAMKKGAAAGDDASRWGAGGAPMSGYGPGSAPGGAGGAGGAGSSSAFGSMSSFGGKNPFATDAAAAKLRDEFARMRKRTGGAINEDVSNRGIFSSGVAGGMMNDAMTQLDLQEGAGLESLFNNAAQQQLAFQLEQERMKNQALYGGGGAQRFSGGDTGGNMNQQLMDLFKQMGAGVGGGGGYSSKADTFQDKFGGSMSGGSMGDLPKGSLPPGTTMGGQNALADLKAQYNMMKSVNPAGAEALKAQIYALGGSV